MPALHRNTTDETTTIAVPGLRQPFRLLHLGDSHVDAGVDRGREAASEFMHKVCTRCEAGIEPGRARHLALTLCNHHRADHRA